MNIRNEYYSFQTPVAHHLRVLSAGERCVDLFYKTFWVVIHVLK